jgi:hypothetical protein
VVVTRDAPPTTANAGVDQTVCATTVTLAANAPTVGTGLWSVVAGTATITAPGDPASGVTGLSVGVNEFVWTVGNGSCAPSKDTVMITRDAPPTTAVAGPDQLISGSSTLLAGNTPSVGSGVWTLVGGTGTVTSPSNPASSVTGLAPGANTFRWTVSNGTCPSSFDEVIITRKLPTTSFLTSSTNPSAVGQSVTFKDSVYGSLPDGGKVYFRIDGAVPGDSVVLAGEGTATLSKSTLTAGTHTVKAFYGGTTAYDTSSSNVVIQVVNQLSIVASAGPNGQINPSGTVPVSYGSSKAFSITPNVGSHVDSLVVDGANLGALVSYQFTNLVANHSIRAYFSIDTFTVAASAGPNGTVNPSGSVTVNYGSNRTFTIHPDTGYHVDSVLVDGAFAGSALSYTFTNITGNHTLRTTFAINTYTITISKIGQGSVSPSGTLTEVYGASISLLITPDTHYGVDSIVMDGASMGSLPGYSLNDISGDHAITVYFGLQQEYGVRYRSFRSDSLYARRATRKKPINDYWEFMVRNTTRDTIKVIKIAFRNYVRQIVSSGNFTPRGLRNNWTFEGVLRPADSVLITGWNVRPNPQTIKKLWLGSHLPVLNIAPRYEHMDIPMPNPADVRNNAFSLGAFRATRGMIVGVPKPDSGAYYGWVRMIRTTDMALSIGNTRLVHTGTPRGFDKRWTTRPFHYEQRSLSPRKHNNRLFADLMALKFNIGISALGIAQPGFGELLFSEDGNPFNHMLVRQIAARGDSAMTFYTTNPGFYAILDSTVRRINDAFSGAIDTLSWRDTLKLKGAKRLIDVVYLEASGIPPTVVSPSAGSLPPDLPLAFELLQNYPNPFNPRTTIQFSLPALSTVTLKVYNILGQEVATLYDQALLDDGEQEVEFNGANLASGVYFYRMTAETLADEDNPDAVPERFTLTRKMMMIK